MPFGFFNKKKKKKEPHYDPTNISVMDIRKGFLLDYDAKSWEVTEEFEYDWGDEYFTYEFKLVCEDENYFLYLEKDDEIEITLSKKISFGILNEEVEKKIRRKGRSPKTIKYDGKTFYRESEGAGNFRNIDNEKWQGFMSWSYLDKSGKYSLTIEEWDEGEYEASYGMIMEESDFSNILPV